MDITAKELIKSYIERINNLDSDKRAIQADIRDIYAEAKGCGFNPKALRQVVKLSRMTQSDRAEQDELVDIYAVAAGLVPSKEDAV